MIIPLECKITAKADQRKWIVPDDFDTIQDAINNASVLAGDIIFVREGTYYENIVVNKSLSLIGENRDSTIIDGGRKGSVISIKGAHNVKIEGFTIKNSSTGTTDCGIYIYYSSGNIIRYNRIVDNYGGLRLDRSDNNIILDNSISFNSYHGINIYISNNNTISFNTISFNRYHGIYLTSSYYNKISNNAIFSNKQVPTWYDGIFILDSNNNVISSNNISDNDNGISLSRAMNNIISGNTFHLNKNYALYLTFSSNNNIMYHNNFYDQVQITGTTNTWDNGFEGNYWPSYIGQDLDEDGIGDASYTIGDNNVDSYPLMGSFSDAMLVLNGKTYYMYLISNSTVSNLKLEIGIETGNRIIRYDITGKSHTIGFSRIMIPARLMEHPLIIVAGNTEITPTWLSISNSTHLYLYFTYTESNYTISIISFQLLGLYYNLLEKYNQLQQTLQNLNTTYQDLFKCFSGISQDYDQLKKDLNEAQEDLDKLLDFFSTLLENYIKLQGNYDELKNSYQKHLSNYSESEQNIRSLMYIFALTTAIFLITTLYLTKKSHISTKRIDISE